MLSKRRREEEQAACGPPRRIHFDMLYFAIVAVGLPRTSAFEVCSLDLPIAVPGAPQHDSQGVRGEWTKLLDRHVYAADSRNGYVDLPESELADLNINRSASQKCEPSTYGEMNAIRAFEADVFGVSEGDVLVDLGCGVGKTVVGGVLFFNASLGVGVELSPTRFRRACAALEHLGDALREGTHCGSRCRARVARPGRIEIVNANMLDANLSQADKAIFFSTCYPEDVQQQMQRKLLRELQVGARVYAPGHKGWTPSLRLGHRVLEQVPDPGPWDNLTYTVVSRPEL